VTTAVAIAVTTVALACPLHMLWRVGQGKRARCLPAGSDPAAALLERQRALAERVETVARSEPRSEPAPDRH